MATSSISGLASGLDTASIIEQLMQLEKIPQSRLQSRISAEKSVVTALQAVNTNTSVLAGKAATLAKPATWETLSAKSSNADVSVTTTSGSRPTSQSIEITALARSHQLGFTDSHALTDSVTGASTTVTLDRLDGTTVALDTGDGSLEGLAAAINDPANETGLRATTIRVGEGQYRLLVESAATGAVQDFALTAEDGSALMGGATVRAGSDAAVSLGTGITATSADGVFKDLLPGTSLTLGAGAEIGDTAQVTVTRDTAGMGAKVKDLVDSLNSLLGDLDTKTASGGGTTTAGVLAGDAGMRSLRTSLLNSVYPADNTSMAKYGIQVSRGGKLELDPAKFAEAYAADPEGVAAAFSSTGNGFAARLDTITKNASSSAGGTITAAITGRKSGIDRLETDVENWDMRLELRRTTLTRQFTALETALSTMSNQSTWLAGQISSLPSWE